jgi:hypothetical protein
MAKGRKPQFSADDLMKYLRAIQQMVAGSEDRYVSSPQLQNAEYLVREGINYATPFTGEELGRLASKGPDQGHLASLALYASLMRANKIPAAVKGAIRSYRGTKDLFRGAGMSPNRAKMPAARNMEMFRE